MQSQDMTDLRQIEFVKSQIDIAVDALQEINDSPEYQALKESIIAKTGGLELEDVLRDAQRFSRGVDDYEAIALGEEETREDETDTDEAERKESLRYWAESQPRDGKNPNMEHQNFVLGTVHIIDPMTRGDNV